MDETWRITQLADEYAVTLRTIRHYEALGLLTPERRGTTRIFHRRDRIRLGLILRGRRMGFSLDEIARIVNMYDEQPGEAGQLGVPPRPDRGPARGLPDARADIDQTERDLDQLERRCRESLREL